VAWRLVTGALCRRQANRWHRLF